VDPLDDQQMEGLLDPGVEFEDKITVPSGLIRINTRLKGTVDCEDAVVIVHEGEVEGDIRS